MPLAPRPENLVRWSVIALVAGVAVLIVFPYEFRQALVNSMLGAMLCLSLVVVVGFVGQISVVQVALAGVTGFTMSHLMFNIGWIWGDFPIAPLIGIAAALIVGLITAVAALRVRGASLAVVTLAGAVAIEQFVFGNAAWGQAATGSPIKPLHVFGLNLSPEASFRGLDGKVPSPVFGFLVLAVLILLCLFVAGVAGARWGSGCVPPSGRTSGRRPLRPGINVRQVKLIAFMASALIAAHPGGVVYAYNFGTVTSDQFGSVNALVIIAYTYFGGITMISGALLAALGATQGLIPQAFQTWFGLNGNWPLLIGAVGLLVTLVVNPDGIAGTAYWKNRAKSRERAAAEAGTAAGGRVAPVVASSRPDRVPGSPPCGPAVVEFAENRARHQDRGHRGQGRGVAAVRIRPVPRQAGAARRRHQVLFQVQAHAAATADPVMRAPVRQRFM